MEIIERKDFKNEVLAQLQAGSRIAIFAPQFFGKTTFLTQIYEELIKNGDIVFFIKFEQIFNAFDFFGKISDEIKIHFGLNLDLDESDITSSLINAFYVIGKLSEKNNNRIFILIDDFDEIVNTQSSLLGDTQKGERDTDKLRYICMELRKLCGILLFRTAGFKGPIFNNAIELELEEALKNKEPLFITYEEKTESPQLTEKPEASV